MLCLVSGCVTILGTFVHAPWTCHSASLKDEKRCVCLNFWAKCSHPWQVSKSQVKIIFFKVFSPLFLFWTGTQVQVLQVYCMCVYVLCMCVWRFLVLLFTPLGLATQHLQRMEKDECVSIFRQNVHALGKSPSPKSR